MQCVICKIGTTYKGKASFTAEKDGAFLIFSSVDAEVCDNCGEAYFSAETTKQLYQKAEEEFKRDIAVEVIKR
jgi:YgiT-type zinc finger domain-containing protein